MVPEVPDNKPVQIRLNGQDLQVETDLTVADLLADLDIAPEHVVVEVDGEILSAEMQETQVLRSGTQIEIVRFVGGGRA
ncbi:MAG: sulfur carrier protein ThiS [Kiritimatiellaeota bacterium]|nr:sulfur carrier protein ThiS [Kiritimatiellota bacterium]